MSLSRLDIPIRRKLHQLFILHILLHKFDSLSKNNKERSLKISSLIQTLLFQSFNSENNVGKLQKGDDFARLIIRRS